MSYDSSQSQWRGEIEAKEGVKILKNPQEPLYGEIKFELEEDLRISSEQDKDYMFYRIRGMAVDSEGHIFIVDMTNFRVLVFDKNGKPVQTIGRQGQGPGEFETPIGMRINHSTGNIYVRDRFTTIDVFKKNGDIEDPITTNLFIEDFFPLDDGTFFINVLKTSEEELKSEQIVCRISDKGEVIHSIAQFPYPALMRRVSTGGTFGTSTGYELSVHVAVIDQNRFIYGYSKSYELNIIDRKETTLYVVRKDAPKPKFTSEEKSLYKTIKFPVPEFKPYYYSLFTDSKGRIYVQTNKAENGIRGYGPIDKAEKEVDIFSPKGYYLYRAVLPRNTKVIKDGYLYSFDLNEEEAIEYIKRFKIKNWNLIKEEIDNH
jgi:hypothetical protein